MSINDDSPHSVIEVTLSDVAETYGKKLPMFRYVPEDASMRDDFLTNLHRFIMEFWKTYGGGIEAMHLPLYSATGGHDEPDK